MLLEVLEVPLEVLEVLEVLLEVLEVFLGVLEVLLEVLLEVFLIIIIMPSDNSNWSPDNTPGGKLNMRAGRQKIG